MELQNQPRKQKCPTCGKAMVHEFRPFCSKRCADVDLHKWLSESYRVPGDSATLPEKKSIDEE